MIKDLKMCGLPAFVLNGIEEFSLKEGILSEIVFRGGHAVLIFFRLLF